MSNFLHCYYTCIYTTGSTTFQSRKIHQKKTICTEASSTRQPALYSATRHQLKLRWSRRCKLAAHPTELGAKLSKEQTKRQITLTSRGGRLTSLDASFMRCFVFFSNIVKNIEVDVFFKTSLKHRIVKQKVRCFMRCFRFQMAWAHNAKNG